MKRVLGLFMCFMLGLCLTGCSKDEYSDNSIIIEIKSDYKNEYVNRLFTLSDFQFENVKSFTYSQWYEENNRGFMFIHLNKTGKKEVNKALAHFETLDFVKSVEKMPIYKLLVN